MRLLVIAPHADDAELGAAGAMLHADEAYVFVVCGTNPARNTEATAAAHELGARIYLGQHVDRDVHATARELIVHIEALVEALAPDVVMIPPEGDTHQDHRATRDAAMSALRRSTITIAEYETPSTPPGWAPNAYQQLNTDDLTHITRALSYYETQGRAAYLTPDAIRARLIAAGTRIGAPAAEPQRIIRAVTARRKG